MSGLWRHGFKTLTDDRRRGDHRNGSQLKKPNPGHALRTSRKQSLSKRFTVGFSGLHSLRIAMTSTPSSPMSSVEVVQVPLRYHPAAGYSRQTQLPLRPRPGHEKVRSSRVLTWLVPDGVAKGGRDEQREGRARSVALRRPLSRRARHLLRDAPAESRRPPQRKPDTTPRK